MAPTDYRPDHPVDVSYRHEHPVEHSSNSVSSIGFRCNA